ncbi:hypothetical protein A2780_03955 [Candidatus Daviesbacteria bacterium RIFCSPHIGHO2_01_FULL_41_45]|nr:MAG: hypothetical protein A2780_03955 [Candidatus Daviesbacteria bacterium RIFCSPHIGHO2_01_FULL_41_45]
MSKNEPRFSEENHQTSPSIAETLAGGLVNICAGIPLLGSSAIPDGNSVHTITDSSTGRTYVGTGSTAEAARQDALSKLNK